jgi:IclR family transcriptional regulator, acetate operon repressor
VSRIIEEGGAGRCSVGLTRHWWELPCAGALAHPVEEWISVIQNETAATKQPQAASSRPAAASAEPAGQPAARYPIESVDNALKLLLMLRQRPAIGVSEASRHLAVARSTAHRLLATLAHHGFVQQISQTKEYAVGPALIEVGLAALRQSDIRARARPLIEELVQEMDETVHLVMLRGRQVVFLDCVEGTRALRAGSRTGTELPAHCTAGGKALLAETADSRLLELYEDGQLEQVTPRSISTRADLLAELKQVRRHGYAINDGESEPGLRAIAVAIRGPSGHPRGGLTMAAPEYRLPPNLLPSMAAALRSTADRIAAILV